MGFILFDFKCTICNHVFEDLIRFDDHNPECPVCIMDNIVSATERVICNQPTLQHDPKWNEIFRKTTEIRNKLIGKVPWRKSSESQSS